MAWICACSAPTDEKLGDDGETCLSDNDCRLEFLCIEGECSTQVSSVCDTACERINDACEAQRDSCIGDCADATAGFLEERVEDFATCVEETSCTLLTALPFRTCAEHNCSNVCNELDRCGVETYDDCARSCSDNTAGWTREEFGKFELCFFLLNCEEIGENADQCFPSSD
jgi:hypothetical protein